MSYFSFWMAKSLIIAQIFLFSCGFFLHAVNAQKTNNPNIIYILADDLGFGEIGAYGQQKIKTPNLDRLAADGMRFTRHYSSAPVCAPSRFMLLTGNHAGHAYIRGNYELGGFEDRNEGGQMPIYEGVPTIAEVLKERGYKTAMIGKWGLGMPHNTGSPLLHGFDQYYGYLDQKQAHNLYPTHLWNNDRRDTLRNHSIMVHTNLDSIKNRPYEYYIGQEFAPQKLTEKALDFLEENKNNPFFLYFPTPLPHLSLQVPEEWVSMYKGKFEETPYDGGKGYAPCKYPLSTYAGMISYLDHQIGQILDKIDELGLSKNTIIMFSSDNGTTFLPFVRPDFFGSTAGLRGYKMELYEGGIRVPFIAKWPGKIVPGSVSDHLSAQYDIYNTIADITGETKENDGISMLPVFISDQKNHPNHEYLYFEYPENGGQIAVISGEWKGIKKNLIQNPDAPWELYLLTADPQESSNLADQLPQMLQEMDEIVKKSHRCAHIKEWEILDKKDRK